MIATLFIIHLNMAKFVLENLTSPFAEHDASIGEASSIPFNSALHPNPNTELLDEEDAAGEMCLRVRWREVSRVMKSRWFMILEECQQEGGAVQDQTHCKDHFSCSTRT